jgi:HAD superfamily hydrolase (TIGR01549 family)
MTVRAVVFDVGETLVDETRPWSWWADRLGVPRLTFHTALGAIIGRNGHFREVFELFRPGFDFPAELEAAVAAGYEPVTEADLYPDALPCLRALIDAGYGVGVAANQPSTTEAVVHALGLPLALVASSETWGVAKPDRAFFDRIAVGLDLPARDIAYVGDRLDNDVRPAAAAGLRAIFVRRGPWGWIQAGRRRPREAALIVEALAELPEALAKLDGA